MLETEVLIVGGGPAGATAGRYLSEKGIENIIVQRNCDFLKPCGGGIRSTAFSEFNIDTSIVEKKVKKVEIGFKDKRLSIDISDSPIYIVNRRVFDKYLREKAKKAGSIIIEGRLVSIKKESSIISTIKTREGKIYIKSRYLISADGVNSTVRKQVSGSYPERIPVSYIDLENIDTDRCSFFFGEKIAGRYYGWVFPHFSGVNIGTYKGKINDFLTFLGVKTLKKPKGYFIPVWKKDEPFYKENIFFVGDSAGQVMPFTFEGIYFAMKSGFIVSQIISENKNPSEYERLWKEMFYNQFYSLKNLQKIFLKNDFSISVMIKLFENPYIQREMIKLWLGKRSVSVDIKFFLRVLKRVI